MKIELYESQLSDKSAVCGVSLTVDDDKIVLACPSHGDAVVLKALLKELIRKHTLEEVE
jgi:predicted RNA-binding Zn-ribbon protein involved in translation (DUF1610 family)